MYQGKTPKNLRYNKVCKNSTIEKCRKNNPPKIPSKSNYENISPKTQLQMNS